MLDRLKKWICENTHDFEVSYPLPAAGEGALTINTLFII